MANKKNLYAKTETSEIVEKIIGREMHLYNFNINGQKIFVRFSEKSNAPDIESVLVKIASADED